MPWFFAPFLPAGRLPPKTSLPIDIFVVDFYCHKYKLAIEVDGDIHLRDEVKEHDDGRSHDIEKSGLGVWGQKNEGCDMAGSKLQIRQEISALIHL